jgi:hypothetical protein
MGSTFGNFYIKFGNPVDKAILVINPAQAAGGQIKLFIVFNQIMLYTFSGIKIGQNTFQVGLVSGIKKIILPGNGKGNAIVGYGLF